MGKISEQGAIVALAETYDLEPLAFMTTFQQVAMPDKYTDAEFVSCCLVAKEHGLNPLTKEIYFMRDKNGKIQPIVGVDGWIKKCNEHPQFDGMDFEDTFDEQGEIISVKCVIFRKDRKHPTAITEYLKECLQIRTKPGPWQTHRIRMLRHRAICQCARVAFGFAGVMMPDEFEQWHNDVSQMKDITPPDPDQVQLPPDPDAAVEEVEIIDWHKHTTDLIDQMAGADSQEILTEIHNQHDRDKAPDEINAKILEAFHEHVTRLAKMAESEAA